MSIRFDHLNKPALRHIAGILAICRARSHGTDQLQHQHATRPHGGKVIIRGTAEACRLNQTFTRRVVAHDGHPLHLTIALGDDQCAPILVKQTISVTIRLERPRYADPGRTRVAQRIVLRHDRPRERVLAHELVAGRGRSVLKPMLRRDDADEMPIFIGHRHGLCAYWRRFRPRNLLETSASRWVTLREAVERVSIPSQRVYHIGRADRPSPPVLTKQRSISDHTLQEGA